MHEDKKSVLLISMPFALTAIPSIQLSILETYLKERNVKCNTKHLYLKTADFYGLKNYNYLINSPNDSYSAQILFTKYVFPNHWQINKEKIKKFFNDKILHDTKNHESFDYYINQTEIFLKWVCENIKWINYDIIGFSLNYGQLMPSLALAKKIKEKDPGKIIIFGGSRTADILGVRLLNAFDYIDFAVSGEGEKPLYALSTNFSDYKSIPRLIYRDSSKTIFNKSADSIDLNTLSVPDFDSYYNDLSFVSEEIKQYYFYYGKLPTEISRGCWWNKCSFCNDKLQFPVYREKNVENIINEILHLSEKYKMLNFQLIGTTLPIKNYRKLFEEIKDLKRDFSFCVESRAGKLTSNDYKLLKEAGFHTIQTGIEAFSESYLDKMNKGVRVIENIASLKYCKENEIKNDYNLIINYPNEEIKDFEETKKNIQFFYQYLDPPRISYLRVLYGSTIYENRKSYGINKLEFTDIDKLMFPEKILSKGFNFYYNFKSNNKSYENNWKMLIKNWYELHKNNEIDAINSQSPIDKLVFYFVDGKSFLRIYDKRDNQKVKIFILDELEREIFLSCMDIITFSELRDIFNDFEESKLLLILENLTEKGLIYKQDNSYLSLPLRFNTIRTDSSNKVRKTLHISGKVRSL